MALQNVIRAGIRRMVNGLRDRGAEPVVSEDAFDMASVLDDTEREIVEHARPFTMVSTERLVACIDAVRYVVARDVPGAIVECGVWKGGSVLAMILTLQRLGIEDRDVYLFDTFEGMTQPTPSDTSRFDGSAADEWREAQTAGRRPWDYMFGADRFGLAGVQDLIFDTGYPRERIHFGVGRVEDTIPAAAPDEIALLRLDTDWYESTKHELDHLYPRLSDHGVLIIDDYGHWDGCRRAVDEYFSSAPIFLSRIDYTGRIAIKRD